MPRNRPPFAHMLLWHDLVYAMAVRLVFQIPEHELVAEAEHIFFFFNETATTDIYTLSLHDALPIFILIKLIRVSLGTVRHPRRFKIVVIDIQITLKQMLRDFIGIRVNRAKKSGMVNITSSVNSRERSGINTILHELNPLFTINVTMRDIKSKNVYSRVNSKATTQWRK